MGDEIEILKCRIRDMEADLERERMRRRDAEERAQAAWDGALDRMELAQGFSGHALLDANRRVRVILSRVIDGADGMTTIGIAKAAAARIEELQQGGSGGGI